MLNIKQGKGTSTNAASNDNDQTEVEGAKADQLKEAVVRANTFLRDGDWQKAEELSRVALSLDSGSAAAHELLFAAVLNSNEPESFLKVVNSALKNCAEEPKFRTVEFVFAALPLEGAKEIHRDVRQKWPNGRLDSALSGLLGIQSDKNILSSRSYLNSPNKVIKQRAVQVKKMVNELPEIASLKRPLVIDKGAELTRSEKVSGDTTVLFFNGLGVDLEHSYEMIDSYFSAAGFSSIFIRDRSLNLCMQGLKSLKKKKSEVLSVLRKMIEDLETTRLIVVGRSAGGYPALQYGLALDANKIVVFSGATDLTDQFYKTIKDTRGPLISGRLNRENSYDDLCLDNLFHKRNAINEGIHMHYGAGAFYDRLHAEHMVAPLGVQLHPISDFDSHHTFIHYLENGGFSDLIAG